MPFCVKHYRICDDREQLVAEVTENHQGRNTVVFDEPLSTEAAVGSSAGDPRQCAGCVVRTYDVMRIASRVESRLSDRNRRSARRLH